MSSGKLVRDLIPDLIRRKGQRPVTRQLNAEEMTVALGAKLIEEAQEAAAALGDRAALVEELADVREVYEALLTHLGIRRDDVAQVGNRKRQERGGFTARTWLEMELP